MAVQLKDTKFGDTIVTKTNGAYSFDAPVDTTDGFSVTGANGSTFSVNNSGDICGNSLSVTGGLSAEGISTGSGGVALSDANVGCGVFTVTSSGNVSVRNRLSIVDGDGSGMAYVSNGSMSLNWSKDSGMHPVFDVNYSCGLLLYDSVNGNSVFTAGNGYLSVNLSSSSGMQSVFNVNGSYGINLYDGYASTPVFGASAGRIFVSGHSSSGMYPVFDVNANNGLSFHNDSGNQVFYANTGALSVCGYNYNGAMSPLFNVSTVNGLNFYNDRGQVLRVGDGTVYVSGYSYSTNGMQPVLFVNSVCGLGLFDDCGCPVFNTANGNLDVRGPDPVSSGYYTKFSIDSCGIYVNLGNASGHIFTTSVPGSGGSSVTVLTLG